MKHPWKKSDLTPLLDLGLTQNQASIYLTALSRGLSTASELSQQTGINRQQVYADTEKLLGIGLLDITRKQRRKFIAADPKMLAVLAEKKISQAHDAATKISQSLPFLETLRKTDTNQKVSVRYFEGMKRLHEAYLQELDACRGVEVLSFVGSVEDLYQFFPESYWKTWNERFVAQKNKSKMLVHYSQKAKETVELDTLYHRETRHSSPFPLKVNVDIFGDVVLILSGYDELAIWIDSPIIADSYRILFKTCWNFASPF